MHGKSSIHVKWQWFGFFCLFIYTVALFYLTLFTHNYYTYGRSANVNLFSSIRLMLDSGNFKLMFENIAGNILLFFPLGFLLPPLWRRSRYLFVLLPVALVTSFFIETMQYEYAERIFDIDDVFLNVIGAGIGWLIVMMVRMLFQKSGR